MTPGSKPDCHWRWSTASSCLATSSLFVRCGLWTSAGCWLRSWILSGCLKQAPKRPQSCRSASCIATTAIIVNTCLVLKVAEDLDCSISGCLASSSCTILFVTEIEGWVPSEAFAAATWSWYVHCQSHRPSSGEPSSRTWNSQNPWECGPGYFLRWRHLSCFPSSSFSSSECYRPKPLVRHRSCLGFDWTSFTATVAVKDSCFAIVTK